MKAFAGIDPGKFVKSTPSDGLAAGLGHTAFKSGSVFYAVVFNVWGQRKWGETEPLCERFSWEPPQLCWSLAINSRIYCASGERLCHQLLETRPPGACKAPRVEGEDFFQELDAATCSRRAAWAVTFRRGGCAAPKAHLGPQPHATGQGWCLAFQKVVVRSPIAAAVLQGRMSMLTYFLWEKLRWRWKFIVWFQVFLFGSLRSACFLFLYILDLSVYMRCNFVMQHIFSSHFLGFKTKTQNKFH